MTVPYATSPIFDALSLPDALRNDHRTKSGTWGLLHVLEGEVRLIFVDPPREQRVTPGQPAIIAPLATHFVVPVGAMRMQVEFYREAPVIDDGSTGG